MRGDDLAEKMKGKNIVMNCLPETEQTKGLLSTELLAKTTTPFYYTTSSRETLHDSKALAEMLAS